MDQDDLIFEDDADFDEFLSNGMGFAGLLNPKGRTNEADSRD